MFEKFTIGLDFGTNSVRALVVRVSDGAEMGTGIWNYTRGADGVIMDANNPELARQHPQDYVDGIMHSVPAALKNAAQTGGFDPEYVIGIGVDTTGSTPMPVDENGNPLALNAGFSDNPSAMAWLWKDHTGFRDAEEITKLAEDIRPEYLAKCGGTYSSEWFWSKILHCLNSDPEVFEAAASWVELADWIPAVLTGTTGLENMKRGICAAGHKAMFNPGWGGYPDEKFLGRLDERLLKVRRSLPDQAHSISENVGELTREWAEVLGLPADIPVAVGAFDAHLGAVGSGIAPGVLVKIIGTSTCDMMVAPERDDLPDIPGLCGIVPESILPGMFGLEAGQSAVGDIFNWFVSQVNPGGDSAGSHEELTKKAETLKAGESGLLALDWMNGNRTVLVDQRLSGLMMGMSLHTTPAEMYLALIEATAFGARVIMERFEEYGLKVERIINCGGISVKNPLVMQVYADIMDRPLEIAASEHACALGAAMAGAVAAGLKNDGHENFEQAAKAMTGVQAKKFLPAPENVKIYDRLYKLYKKLHDAFGTQTEKESLFEVMKELLRIRDEAKGT